MSAGSGGPELTSRVRMRYTRTGRVRFLAHLDFMTLVHRAAVRAGVPVAFSQGFNPHPKFAFGPALPVGMESEAEYLDIETDPFIDLRKATDGLNQALPEGIRIMDAKVVPKKALSLSGSIGRYAYTIQVPPDLAKELPERVRVFLEQPQLIISRKGKEQDIRPAIEGVEVRSPGAGAELAVMLQDAGPLKPRVLDVLMRLFSLGEDDALMLRVTRTALYCRDGDRWISPMEVG